MLIYISSYTKAREWWRHSWAEDRRWRRKNEKSQRMGENVVKGVLLLLWLPAQELHKFKLMASVTIPTGSTNLTQCVKDRQERTLRWKGDMGV